MIDAILGVVLEFSWTEQVVPNALASSYVGVFIQQDLYVGELQFLAFIFVKAFAITGYENFRYPYSLVALNFSHDIGGPENFSHFSQDSDLVFVALHDHEYLVDVPRRG